jgi:hypothetical protein
MRSNAPRVCPSSRCSGHGSRASTAIAPIPSQAGQCRGDSGGDPAEVGEGGAGGVAAVIARF